VLAGCADKRCSPSHARGWCVDLPPPRQLSLSPPSAVTVTSVGAVTRLPGGQRLSRGQLTVERGVFDKVADEEVTAAAGDARRRHVVCAELFREVVVQLPQRGKLVEHLPVAGGVSPPAGHDVAPVRSLDPDRVTELAAAGDGLGQLVTERAGRLSVQLDAPTVNVDADRVTVVAGSDSVPAVGRGSTVAVTRWSCPLVSLPGEFLDQPPRGDFGYPPGRCRRPTYTALRARRAKT